MTERDEASQSEFPKGLLRRRDQFAVALLALAALAGVVCWWMASGGGRGRLIEAEHAPPRRVEFLVDVNSASWPELAQLPGIGETLARRIVDNRRQRGPFTNLDDLVYRVPGIGPKKYRQIKPYLCLAD
jgi:competence protein ComEA